MLHLRPTLAEQQKKVKKLTVEVDVFMTELRLMLSSNKEFTNQLKPGEKRYLTDSYQPLKKWLEKPYLEKIETLEDTQTYLESVRDNYYLFMPDDEMRAALKEIPKPKCVSPK